MKRYLSHSISIRYDPKQDRLQCICHQKSEQKLSVWISRRMLLKVLPKTVQWLEKQSDNRPGSVTAKVKTQAEKRSIVAFEHEVAQYEASTVQQTISINIPFEEDFLLYSVTLSAHEKNQVVLIFEDEDKSTQVVFTLSLTELHKILGEFFRLSDAAGWKVNNPWKTEHSTQIRVAHSNNRLM